MRKPMTRDQALAILAYDISDMVSRADGYDGLIPDDQLTQDQLIAALPRFFRSLGFDPFPESTPAGQTPAAPAEPVFVAHTCNGGRGPFYGRKTPGCPRCDQLIAGAAPREAPPAVQAAKRRHDDDERRRREWEDHITRKHHNGRCADGVVCTFGQW